MSSDPASNRPEIVIVRRRAADDGSQGKGGSWKIAYADFVTAMMAFFLVMWLINASNEKVKKAVANYFNPIRLTDTATGARSILDSVEIENANETKKARNGQMERSDPKEPGGNTVLANPPVALDLIEKRSSGGNEQGAKTGKSDDLTPASRASETSPGVGDPFDPKSWQNLPVQTMPAADAPVQSGQNEGEGQSAGNPAKGGVKPSPAEQTSLKEQRKSAEQQATQIFARIAQALGKTSEDLKGSVDVKLTPDGFVISLTENEKFEMFSAGSAEPEAETIRLVAAVAKAIQDVPGGIYVRGHTDSRPFRNNFYDNWQLSTARAHVARYMLVRGGLDDARIQRVEGVADREPLNAGNPLATENRRIEFFIQVKKQ